MKDQEEQGGNAVGVVTVARYHSEQEGYLARGLLESHGIEAEVSYATAMNLYRTPQAGPRRTLPPCQLLVRAEDAHEAARVLRITEARHVAEEGEVTTGGLTQTLVHADCPACGHETAMATSYQVVPWIRFVPPVIILSVIAAGLIPNATWQIFAVAAIVGGGINLAWRQADTSTAYTCINCGADIPPHAVKDHDA